MTLSETATRTVVALIAIPIGVALVVVGGWALALLLGAVAVAAVLEFYRLAAQKGVESFRVLGGATAALFVAFAAVDPSRGPDGAAVPALLLAAVLAGCVSAIWGRGVSGQPLLVFSTTVAGAVYTGYLLSFALFLRHLPRIDSAWHGTALLFAPVLLTWASDTAAYFVGRRFGTRKLIPSVSPGKTVQGAIGAVIGSVVVAVGYSYLLAQFSSYRLTLLEAAVFGLVVSVVAQVGDLAESLFKRDAGVKDSGTLLPGHGGALDRFDSLLFTLPVGYYFFRLLFGGVPVF